jgi:glycosyltransferase involved in cell wall biosynthesis
VSPAAAAGKRRRRRPVRISVIVPSRNAADWIVACLEPIRQQNPGEIILVDGHSGDGTVLLAEAYVDRVIRDDGRGPGAARNLGVEAARHTWVAFVDADVVVPPGSLEAMVAEARQRNLIALQAGLHSSGTDYWSEQLAWHHNNGRSRSWFGVSATVMRTSEARTYPFDPNLRSGEDVDLRLRLATGGEPVGVSETTIVEHRFAPSLDAARAQWSADGAGLGRVVRSHGRAALRELAIPFVAAAYWMARSIGAPRRLPYFIGFLAGNWRGAVAGLLDQGVPLAGSGAGPAVVAALAGLWMGAIALAVLGVAIVIAIAVVVPAVPRLLEDAIWLPVLAIAAAGALVWLEVASTLPEGHRWQQRAARYRTRILIVVVVIVVATALRLGATLRLLH